MEKRRHRSHDPCEHFRGRGETEAKNLELIDSAVDDKPQELPAGWMNRNLKVGILEIDGDHPVEKLLMDWRTDWLDSILNGVS